MKQLNVCLILCITLFAATNAFQFSSLLEVQQLKSSLFGSNLIETIALTFQSDDKVSSAKEVLSMLENLQNELKKDQFDDNEKFEKKRDEFDAHITKLGNEITELTNRINYLISEIERLSGLIEQATKNIASFDQRIANLEALLNEMQTANIQDNKYYKEKIGQLAALYNTFTTIIERLDKLTGSVSAINVPTHVNLTDAEKRDLEWKKNNPGVESKLGKSFLQVESESSEMAGMIMQLSKDYDSFLETTLNADQGALKKLTSILTAMQEEILKQKTATTTHLDNINNKYAEMKVGVETEISSNKDARKSQIANKEKYTEEKNKNIEEKTNKEKRRELLQTEKTINEDLRSQLKSTFEKERIERTGELEIVQKLIKIVENRLVKKAF